VNHTAPAGDFCLTVSALVFTAEEPRRVLVHQHKRYPVVIQPGGHVDLGEHPWAAVLRELTEEAGIVPDQLAVLSAVAFTPGPGRFPAPVALDVHRISADAAHTDLVFAFVIDGVPRAQPQPGESLELSWLTVAELIAHPAVPERIATLAASLEPAFTGWLKVPASQIGLDPRPLPQ
jgi:8-oxo-dGTP pyrophosphatase MutT (NUDIX family)